MSGGGENNFKAKDFAMRAQKKILGQFANRKTAKALIDESLSSLLDLVYQLMKCHVRHANFIHYEVYLRES